MEHRMGEGEGDESEARPQVLFWTGHKVRSHFRGSGGILEDFEQDEI